MVGLTIAIPKQYSYVKGFIMTIEERDVLVAVRILLIEAEILLDKANYCGMAGRLTNIIEDIDKQLTKVETI